MTYEAIWFSLIAYFEGEEGAEAVAGIFKDALADKAEVFVCVVNWGEMYYIVLREGGDDKAELYKLTLAKYPITIVEANKELTLQAARYKAFHRISYADAYATALTKLRKAGLVTGDKEFKSLEKEITVHWIL